MKKIILIGAIVFTLSSCGNIDKNVATKIKLDNSIENVDKMNNIVDKENDTNQNILENKIKKLKYIKDVSIVITNDFAVIGLELDENLNDKDIMAIKNQVKALTKSTDNKIKFVSITTTPVLIEKINQLDIPNETEVERITLPEELEETVIELTPQL